VLDVRRAVRLGRPRLSGGSLTMPAKVATAPAQSRHARAALRAVRCASGMTQEQAAAACGVSPRVWRKWESGRGALLALDAYLILGGLAPANDNPRRRAAAPCPAAAVRRWGNGSADPLPRMIGPDTALSRRAA
jgi:hypothetical protein